MIPVFKQNASQQNHRHDVHISLFIYLFSLNNNLIPLTEYAQRKGNRIIPKALLYKYMYYFFLPYTNFRALQILPPLKIISPSRFVRKGIQKNWFVIQLLVYSWFKNSESRFFIVNRGWLGETRYLVTYYVGYKLDRLR